MARDPLTPTPADLRALAVLVAQDRPITAGWFARILWSDSNGWDRRSHRHATPAGGAMAVGLKMRAGVTLGRLWRMGYASRRGSAPTYWTATEAGRRAAAA
jgi:hypothetical protein